MFIAKGLYSIGMKLCGYCEKNEVVCMAPMDDVLICQECKDADDSYWDMMNITSDWNQR